MSEDDRWADRWADPWTEGPCDECGCDMQYARAAAKQGPFICTVCRAYERGYKAGKERAANSEEHYSCPACGVDIHIRDGRLEET